jgi:hypothetical protein
MKNSDIAQLRLYNQQISVSKFNHPADCIAWLGAVQAQDYLGALWAVGLRSQQSSEAAVEKAIADKTIVRTWPMRGTIHFVAASDARWMLELLAPRVLSRSKGRLKQLELDETTLARSRKLLTKTLQGGKQMRRDALYRLLERSGISTAGQRGIHILAQLSQEGILCSGAREGKQHTFTLLQEWAPNARKMERDEALAEITRRYFTSHGPATLQDFMWWSGLTSTDAKAGIAMAKPHLVEDNMESQTYWLSPSTLGPREKSPAIYLLPPFDEYTVAYKDRTAVLNSEHNRHVNTGYGIFAPIIVLNGQVVGSWKRAIKKDKVEISKNLFTSDEFTKAENRAFDTAVNRYAEFLGMTAILS